MKYTLNFLRQFTWQRILLVIALTTIATVIIKPYFLYGVGFWYLWLRLFVVAVVMLFSYIAAGELHARFSPRASSSSRRNLSRWWQVPCSAPSPRDW